MSVYDTVVIGAGPGGYVAAIRSAQLGLKTAVVEKEALGGTCLNWGCIPSKTLLTSAELYLKASQMEQFGITFSGELKCDWQKIVQRKTRILQTLRNGIRFLLKKNGVELITGMGLLGNSNTVCVRDSDGEMGEYEAKKIILATGSKPARIPAFNIDGDRILTTNEIFDIPSLPPSMLVVGGGVNGCEFATMLSAFGVRVTLIEMLPAILQLTPLPETVTRKVAAQLKKQGVEIVTGAKIASLRVEDGHVAAELEAGVSYTAEKALVTIGRERMTTGIGLENAGLETGRGGCITVNEFMQTANPDIYAIGDITPHIQLAHLASRQGILAVEHAYGKEGIEQIDYDAVPACIFTHKPVAYVGRSEAEHTQCGTDCRSVEFQYRSLGIGHVKDETDGCVWVTAEKGTERILSGGVYGYGAPELVHTIAAAVANSLTVTELNRVVYAHPTFAETIGESLEALHFKAIHA